MPFSKKLFSILSLPFIIVLFSVLVSKPANAAEFHFNNYTLAQDQTINDDLYITTTNTEVNGLVNGDLVIFAKTATVTGTISGDVYIAAQTIVFKGNVYGNVYLAGENITINGNVKENLDVIGATVVADSQVEKDFFGIANNLQLRGTVGDDARFIGSSVYTKATVGGDLISLSNSADTKDSIVRGNTYTFDSIKAIAKQQGVDWDAKATEIKEDTTQSNWSNTIFGALFSFVSMGLVGYLMIMAAPIKTGKILAKITGSSKDLVFSFLIGLLVLVAAPLAFILLCLSFVGLPLALLVFGILLFLTFFGRLWVEVAFGQEILDLCKVKGYRPFKSLAIGRLISVIINLVPVIGFIYSLVLMSIATGAFIRMKKEYWDRSKK